MNRASSRVNKGQYNTVKFHNTPDSIIQKSKAKKPQQPKQPKQPRQPRQPRQPANNPIQEQPVVDAPQNNVAMPAVYIGNTVIPDENFLTMSDEDYWRDNFYIPNDHITKDYYEIAEIYPEIPASMIYGLGDLEVKTPEPIKEKPSLTKLINGDYQTEQSKSDKNIATSIRFFVNNLPTFQQYKGRDELDWVVNHHRLLTTELLVYSHDHKSSIATLKSKFNAITRIIRLTYRSKTPDLYRKFSQIVLDLGHYFDMDEAKNELSPEEEKKFITWEVVMAKQKELEKQFNTIKNKNSKIAYELNNDLLLLSLYSLIPPLRNEVKHLKFTHKKKDDYDYIYLSQQGNVWLDLNLEKKRHDPIEFNLSNEAPKSAKIIEDSYKLYPHEFVFTPKNTYPRLNKKASQSSLDQRLRTLFSQTGKSVSVNSLRSSYVSYKVHQGMVRGKLLSVGEKNKIAEKMRSSRKYLDESYTKLFEMNHQQHPMIKQEENTNAPVIDETNSYDRQKARAVTYYHTHRNEMIQKQKEYQKKKGSFANSRTRLLRFLNSSPDYEQNMRDTTKSKYNFKKVNGIWE